MLNGSPADLGAVSPCSTVEILLDCEGRVLSRWTADQWSPALITANYEIDNVPYRVVAYTVPTRQDDGTAVSRLYVQPDRPAHRPTTLRSRRQPRHLRARRAA